MKYITAAYTDVGIKKMTNQDSLLIMQAETDYGAILLAVLCDGMGGLQKGEVASASLIRDFSDWFRRELPVLLQNGLRQDALRDSWDSLIQRANVRIGNYGISTKISLGTTCVSLLLVGDLYYILNVGDSRIYLISDSVYQLTKDQTYVQRELDANRMTYEQSLVDPQRSVLLQCVGASDIVEPAYYIGTTQPGQCFLLCCDGFRHVVEPAEFFEYLNPKKATDAKQMRENLIYLTELNKERQETDNITAALIKTY